MVLFPVLTEIMYDHTGDCFCSNTISSSFVDFSLVRRSIAYRKTYTWPINFRPYYYQADFVCTKLVFIFFIYITISTTIFTNTWNWTIKNLFVPWDVLTPVFSILFLTLIRNGGFKFFFFFNVGLRPSLKIYVTFWPKTLSFCQNPFIFQSLN